MTDESRQVFLADRVRALATVLLTRRGDLSITDTKRDTGLDLHVTIDREDNPMRLVFGILLRGVYSPSSPEHANKVLGPTMGQFRGMRKFTYPVCLFFFTTKTDQAFFSWLAEPTVEAGTPKLVHRENADCRELTDDLLAHAIQQIITWYDSVASVLIA